MVDDDSEGAIQVLLHPGDLPVLDAQVRNDWLQRKGTSVRDSVDEDDASEEGVGRVHIQAVVDRGALQAFLFAMCTH